MSLIPNWRLVLKHAWSTRLLILAGVLSAIEAAIPFFYDNPPIPRGTFAILTLIVTMAAFIARFYAQGNCHED